MANSIREMINGYKSEMLSKNLVPQRAAEILNQASALLGNINDEILRTDVAYNVVLEECLNTEEKANRALIRAKCTDEYREMMVAKNTEKEATAIIRAIKYFLKVKEREYESAKYQ